ncbi:MAG: cytochrome c [Cyclobacteriaceae bacterium]|nr:cytochrome c [Cyclobacteriaceae bacterium]
MKLMNAFKLLAATGAFFLIGCKAHDNNPGFEYAPNMYHSVAYEPLKQIMDKDAGKWVNSSGEDIGEYYSSNPNNPFSMNMRVPPANTVKRGEFLPYRIPKDSLEYASRVLKNPLTGDMDELTKEGGVLYGKFCLHCHGPKAMGDGPVGSPPADDPNGVPPFAGVANLQGAALKNITEGHIFHVITWGKGRMGSHASQLNQRERWEIAMYVKKLQNQ